MIRHSLRIITLHRGRHEKKRRVIRFTDPKYHLLALFINAEADSFRREINAAFEQAETEGEGFFAGNLTTLSIHDGIAELCSQLDEEQVPLLIEAKELEALLSEWYSKR